MEQSGISVLLVEDDIDLRDSVTEWLEMAGMAVTSVSCAAEFYPAVSGRKFQVAIVDVGLPDQSGYVLAEYLRSNTNSAIIMLTARGGIDDKVKGYGSGADLYLVKPVDCRELSAAIASISARARQMPLGAQPGRAGWLVSASQWKLRTDTNVQIALSAKELKFLELLAATPGQPVPRATVLAQLYQRHDYYTARSLDSLVRRLRAKVAAETGAEIPIRTVHAVGYCFVGPIGFC